MSKPTKRHRTPRMRSDKMIKHIVGRYENGENSQQIANDVGYSRQNVDKIINQYSTPRRRGRRSKLKITTEEILKRKSDGESIVKIAKAAGCSGSHIRAIVKKGEKQEIVVNKLAFSAEFDEINTHLYESIKKDHQEELDRLQGELGDNFESDFLGFVDAYYYLSKLIPVDRTIYDMGCCWGFQSYLFRNHKKYIGVDAYVNSEKQLKLPNNEYHDCTIKEFLEKNEIEEKHFAICNYIPPYDDDNEKLVRNNFEHLYVYFP